MPDKSQLPPEDRPDAPRPTPGDAVPTPDASRPLSGDAAPGPDAPRPTSGDARPSTDPPHGEPTLPPVAGPDAQGPTPGSAAPSSAPLPDEAELARVAEPATVRRAPRYRAFLTAGVLVGAVVGFLVALVTGPSLEGGGGTGFISFLDGQGSARLLVALAGATVGALVAGVAAVVADRRSVRGR